jgi:hypothetical protein
MQSVRFVGPGTPLRSRTLQSPTPGPGQVVVEIGGAVSTTRRSTTASLSPKPATPPPKSATHPGFSGEFTLGHAGPNGVPIRASSPWRTTVKTGPRLAGSEAASDSMAGWRSTCSEVNPWSETQS